VGSAKPDTKTPAGAKQAADSEKPDRDLGNALRRAYDETVNESVPDDLLDLLKKLD
jgi:hypothetical protein